MDGQTMVNWGVGMVGELMKGHRRFANLSEVNPRTSFALDRVHGPYMKDKKNEVRIGSSFVSDRGVGTDESWYLVLRLARSRFYVGSYTLPHKIAEVVTESTVDGD